MTTSAATAGLLNGLDDAQRAAVTTDASPLAIIAAAGSGKTTVLTRRIAHRISSGDAAARHVLALTFTRDAAGELHRRLRRLDLREPIEAGTFHSVALRLLRDRAVANDRPIPHVAPDRVRLVREVLTQLRLRGDASGVVADLDWARARMVAPDDFDRAARSARRRTSVATGSYHDVVGRCPRQQGSVERPAREIDNSTARPDSDVRRHPNGMGAAGGNRKDRGQRESPSQPQCAGSGPLHYNPPHATRLSPHVPPVCDGRCVRRDGPG